MIGFTGALKIYLALEPQDMRKSFNGLYAAAQEQLGEDPRGGALFVFCNKRRNRIKTLYFGHSQRHFRLGLRRPTSPFFSHKWHFKPIRQILAEPIRVSWIYLVR